jgi:hypothetical protein
VAQHVRVRGTSSPRTQHPLWKRPDEIDWGARPIARPPTLRQSNDVRDPELDFRAKSSTVASPAKRKRGYSTQRRLSNNSSRNRRRKIANRL